MKSTSIIDNYTDIKKALEEKEVEKRVNEIQESIMKLLSSIQFVVNDEVFLDKVFDAVVKKLCPVPTLDIEVVSNSSYSGDKLTAPITIVLGSKEPKDIDIWECPNITE